MVENNRKNDVFADIAASGIDFQGKHFIEPQPPLLEQKYMKIEGLNEDAIFEPMRKMDGQEELFHELERQKLKMAPFMKNHAPVPDSFRQRSYIKDFQWRVGTSEDQRDFQGVLSGKGEWEEVTIPHYGGPLGKAMTYYRTSLPITEEQMAVGALFICLKGVDYKAHVFINGCFLGSHEGFFAPFEFECRECIQVGENILVIKVENDFIFGSNANDRSPALTATGDKLYAATGPGYDDPERGWHHCPPGMGIYQEVYIEARPRVYIGDIFVRSMEDLQNGEAWIEIHNCDPGCIEANLGLSLYGKNFEETLFEHQQYIPTTGIAVGMGDSFTEAILRAEGKLNTAIPLYMEKGNNRLIIPFKIPQARIWDLETPWLYQLNIELIVDHQVVDTSGAHFGMRSFTMDVEAEIKGRMYLNGRQIRLRGANTMGHEQQCVMKGDFEQLRDDILLAKICRMNFLRITQRPVQPEVYAYCDMLGLMIQTDLPLFGVMGRSKFCEGIKQAEEMERLIRNHPSCIMVSYINEPFPNAKNKPQRFLTRPELLTFFEACDIAVKLNNPDRVIKHVDGDYDPPSVTLPDNHCYPAWYNGHGIDIGKLHRGYWLPVKSGWYYGCGEYGAEGLDPVSLMEKRYPKEWLPSSKEEEKSWSPNRIIGAQTGKFHYFFYETPESMEEWVEESWKYQAWATTTMTEAFRRDNRMTTFAIHLFIDAFPAGWMKTIMDAERRPKPAYFAYRDALEPLMVNIRSDRSKFFEGEEIKLEAWICNDPVDSAEDGTLKVMLQIGDEIVAAVQHQAVIPSCSSAFQGYLTFQAPNVTERTEVRIEAALTDAEGVLCSHKTMNIEIFPKTVAKTTRRVLFLGEAQGKAETFIREIGMEAEIFHEQAVQECIVIDTYEQFRERESILKDMVEKGCNIIFLDLLPGEYEVFGEKVVVKISGMSPLHFVSRKTNHPYVNNLKQDDFRLWYSAKEDRIKPILENTFTAQGFTPVLYTGNTNENGEWGPALAAGEKYFGQGSVLICQVDLVGRVDTNPVAAIFAQRLLDRVKNG